MSTPGTTKAQGRKGSQNAIQKLNHGAKVLWISILCGANVATILLLWFVCLSTMLEPSVHPRAAQAGLLFPVFLGLDTAFIFIWLITSWKWVALPLAGMLFCCSYIRDYCPLNMTGETPDSTLKVLSYNVCTLAKVDTLQFDGSVTAGYIENSDADIICLQECQTTCSTGKELLAKMDSLGYETRIYGSKVTFSKLHFVGKAVFRSTGKKGNGFVAYRVTDGRDTLLLVNMHLQSNGLSHQEKSEYKDAIKGNDRHMLEDSGRLMLSHLSGSASKREQQTDSLCTFFSEHKQEKIIVCGDMNDTPISYSYQRFAKVLDSAFRQSGNGIGISYNQKGFPVRIDHIFVSEALESFATHIDASVTSSDHYPILTYVRSKVK